MVLVNVLLNLIARRGNFKELFILFRHCFFLHVDRASLLSSRKWKYFNPL